MGGQVPGDTSTIQVLAVSGFGQCFGSSLPTHMAPAWGEEREVERKKRGLESGDRSSGRLERPKDLFYFIFSQAFQQKMKLENRKCPFGSAHNSPFEIICWFCSFLRAFHSSL